MKKRLTSIFAAAFFMLLPLLGWGQAKVYTKRVLLEDFPVRTTKVVLAGQSFLDMTLRDEVASRWRVSPYEFCSVDEYENQKKNNSYYFLRMVLKDGIVFLDLSKGGDPEVEDRMKRPVDVVSIPISQADVMSGDEIVYMGAFLDIIQKFTEEAIISDKVGYIGLTSFNGRSMKGKDVYLDEETAREKYQDAQENAVIGICIYPEDISTRSKCFRMLITADTNELYYYNEDRYRGPSDRSFTDKEIKSFNGRHAITHRQIP